MKVTRTLNEMQADIAIHEAAIKQIQAEIKVFQSECPHPENFVKQTSSSSKDETLSTVSLQLRQHSCDFYSLSSYTPLTKLKEWTTFLRNCGGFKIC